MALKGRRMQQLAYSMAMPEPLKSAEIKYVDSH
jgi:hypothetical protein